VSQEEAPSTLNQLCTALQPSVFWIYLVRKKFTMTCLILIKFMANI